MPESSLSVIPRRGRAWWKAQTWGVEKAYTDYQPVLNDPEIDLVEILVPHHLHAEMTVASCEMDKHVSVLKPMAPPFVNRSDFAEAERAGVVLRVFENFIFYPLYVRAKQMIESGEIGEPQIIRLHVNTGTRSTSWDVPLSAWVWRFDEGNAGASCL